MHWQRAPVESCAMCRSDRNAMKNERFHGFPDIRRRNEQER